MKIKSLFLVLSSLLLVNTLCLPVQAKSMIYDILNKGSEWTLNVDGEDGILELLGGKGSSTGGSGWRMSMEIRWQGNNGSLQAEADNENSQQRVVLTLQRQNGMAVTCEGYIAQETDRLMAGITRYPALDKNTFGAWYAVKKQTAPVGLTRKPPLRTDIIKDARRNFPSADSEPPKVYIKVEGILVFTLDDKIKIRANAEDNVKVAQITVYIDDQEKKTCQAWECWYSETLTQPGPHKCWATAIDTAGNKGQSAPLEFMVQPTTKPGPQTGSCSISGKAYGSGAGLAKVFFVILYGPDNLSLHRETQPFGQDGIYSFTGLPAGKYKLAVGTKADTTIGPHPANKIVECTGGPINNVDFELK